MAVLHHAANKDGKLNGEVGVFTMMPSHPSYANKFKSTAMVGEGKRIHCYYFKNDVPIKGLMFRRYTYTRESMSALPTFTPSGPRVELDLATWVALTPTLEQTGPTERTSTAERY